MGEPWPPAAAGLFPKYSVKEARPTRLHLLYCLIYTKFKVRDAVLGVKGVLTLGEEGGIVTWRSHRASMFGSVLFLDLDGFILCRFTKLHT